MVATPDEITLGTDQHFYGCARDAILFDQRFNPIIVAPDLPDFDYYSALNLYLLP